MREAPPLRCGSGLVLSVQIDGSCLSGPWGWFAVEHVSGPVPGNAKIHDRMDAGSLLVLLDAAGWPESQLGRRWQKKPSVIIRPRREG